LSGLFVCFIYYKNTHNVKKSL